MFAYVVRNWHAGIEDIVYSTLGTTFDTRESAGSTWARWTPVATPVPEPSSSLLLATGIAVLAGYRWWKRRRERTQAG